MKQQTIEQTLERLREAYRATKDNEERRRILLKARPLQTALELQKRGRLLW